jgi:cell division septation protein DedD
MTINQTPPSPSSRSVRRSAIALRCALAAVLGVTAAVLISCGSSGAGLIPAGNAGPLQGDFEAIAQAAQSGNGSCTATEAAIVKAERDFQALPSSVNGGLRNTLRQGISNLRARALLLCSQPLQQPTVTSTTTKSTQTATTPTTPTTTQTTPTQTTPTNTTTTPTTTGPGGGTPAPSGEPAPPGGTEPGGAGAGGQEGGR